MTVFLLEAKPPQAGWGRAVQEQTPFLQKRRKELVVSCLVPELWSEGTYGNSKQVLSSTSVMWFKLEKKKPFLEHGAKQAPGSNGYMMNNKPS